MLPSEKIELAIYRYIGSLGPGAVTTSLALLYQAIGENHATIVERLKSLEAENRIALFKYLGGGRWPRASVAGDDRLFFYTDSFLVEIVPQGRRYFEELEVRSEPSDRQFALLAIKEARRSISEDDRVHPRVGAVVVKDGKMLATAHRGEAEGSHAEYIALERKLVDVAVAGATIYTTLEPCTTRNHPKIPCAERLIERRIGRVVIGMLDPDPRISGKGILKLRSANIITDLFPHDLMAQVEELNREFMRKCGVDSKAAQVASKVAEPMQLRGRLTEQSRKEMIAALKPFAVSGRLIDLVKYANDSQVADLAYQISAVLRDAGWKPTEYVRTSYEPLSGLLIEIDPKNPPTRAAADALLFALSAAGLSVAGPVSSLPRDIGFTVPPGAGAAIRLTIGAIASR